MSVVGRDSEAAVLAQAASDLLEPMYARLTRLAQAVVTSRPAGAARWSESDLGQVHDLLRGLLVEDSMAVGMGFVAAPGEIDGLDRYMAWWQRKDGRSERLRLNFDATSIDVYDYLQMEWFQLARQGRPRVAFGPYVDYSGAELYVVTATVPVFLEGRFVGVTGVDLSFAELERRLIAALRPTAFDAVIVSPERRVIAANTPRWVIGARLPELPRPPEEGGLRTYVDVAELPVGTGWVIALAAPE